MYIRSWLVLEAIGLLLGLVLEAIGLLLGLVLERPLGYALSKF
jgi:hypothetical protein